MRSLLRLIATVFLLQTSLLANYQSIYIPDQLKQDLSEGKVAKYQTETIPTASLAELQQRGVLGSDATLTRHISGTPTFDAILAADVCKVDTPQAYTSTIYEMDLPSGIITCMYAAKGDLYNPMGLYKVVVPEIKAYYAINSEAAKVEKAAEIANAERQFQPLIQTKANIVNQMQQQTSSGTFLTIPELIYAAILTDEQIVDIDAARATGKFQLKQGYSSKFTQSNEVVDNSEYLLTDTVSIFKVYGGLAQASMNFLILMTLGFGAYGGIKYFGGKASKKLEKKQSNEAEIPYLAGIFAGLILFFPQSETTQNGDYTVLHNRYQGFEKFGYYNFNEWAKTSAKVIIDSELDSVIAKTGLGTKEQIVDTTAQATQAQKLDAVYTANYNVCVNNIYKSDYLTHTDGKTVFGESDKSMFPTTEHWGYVALAAKPLTEGYYEKGSGGSLQDSAAGEGEYPKIAFSACGKADSLSNFYRERKTQLQNSYNSLVQSSGSAAPKIVGMEKIIEFQYKLYRDWGYLSVLALPIAKMQAERLSGINKNTSSQLLEKLNQNIAGEDKMLHSLLSAIPYMYVPGSQTVFEVASGNSIAIGAAGGAVIGSQVPEAQGWFSKAFYTAVGAVDGAAIGWTSAGSGAIGMGFAYMAGKITLTLLPILGLTMIGVLRFITIIVKSFSYHFVSLFVMPIIFIQRNIELMAKLTARVLATMLELPIFVLAVWLAMTANSLIHTIGITFSKMVLSGMIENGFIMDPLQMGNMSIAGQNASEWSSKMLIYLFDGFFEVAVAAFSIVIIYKIIISLHKELFDAIDLTANSAIDSSIESMRQEGNSWGAKI